jgi:hypothetical protein
VVSSTAGQLGYYPNSNNVIAGNSNITIATGAGLTTLTIGVSGTNSGVIAIPGSTSGTISLVPQVAAGTYNWNWPITAGSAGQVLVSQGGGSTAMTWGTAGVACCTYESSAFNAAANTGYCVDTSGGAVTATLEASPATTDTYYFIDCKNSFQTHNLTLGRNGNPIMNVAANFVDNLNNFNFALHWDSNGSNWNIGP